MKKRTQKNDIIKTKKSENKTLFYNIYKRKNTRYVIRYQFIMRKQSENAKNITNNVIKSKENLFYEL